MAEYDKWGFDKDGYNRDGYNKMGFNREGYNRQGFNIHGFNSEGFNQKTLRDCNGYDAKGFDADGFNSSGYNSDGYDREGYNKDGYDKEGYNIYGYNQEGIDREGFNIFGFDAKGYDKEGFDRNGYDKNGFNHYGYDCDGYTAEGYDKEGYDRKGYDSEGFDKEGYDKNGVDAYGYDREGFDKWGFDEDGLDREGFDIYGYDVEGYNILGFDTKGFDRNGIHRYGFLKADFDENGFHAYTGFNLQGYDKEGYNINGYNESGYDRNGYDIEGYDKAGYNINGFNINGYDINGFNQTGYNIFGFDKNGYDVNGFDRYGIDNEGYNREGYDSEGYDRLGYNKFGEQKKYSIMDLKPGMTVYHVTLGAGIIKRMEEGNTRKYIVLTYPFSKEEYTYLFPDVFTNSSQKFLSIEKPESLKQKEESYSETENQKEINKYSETVRFLRGDYLNMRISQASVDFSPNMVKFINSYGFVEEKECGRGIKSITESVENEVGLIVRNPYFAHIDYLENHNLYIGKKEIPERVTDWADKKASLYYQYQMYIGNEKADLKLVRGIDFGDGRYMGYRDLYNALTEDNTDTARIADERLKKIITSNQKDKKIHDIIQTIQKNQYEIITQNRNENLLVIGCAGSGKTMILMHRIRFMKYNEPDFDMQKIVVISPTDILGQESQELSRILDVDAIKQMTMTAFYRTVAEDLLKDYFNEKSLLGNIPIEPLKIDVSLYSSEKLHDILKKIESVLDLNSIVSLEYRRNKANEFDSCKKQISERYGTYKAFIHLEKIYLKAREELNKYNQDDIRMIIRRCEGSEEEIEQLSNELNFIEFLYSMVGFATASEEEFTRNSNNFNGFLSCTKKLCELVDLDEIYRYVKNNEFVCDSISRFIQLLCAFEKTVEKSEINDDLLNSVRNELCECSDKMILSYISLLKRRKYALEEKPRKAEIMRYLLATGMVRTRKQNHRLTDQQLITAGDDIKYFFDEMNWVKGAQNPFVDLDAYEEIQSKEQRLLEFELGKNKWRFLQDIIIEEVGIRKENGEFSVNASQIFAICFLLQHISNTKNYDKHYFFIDEFQDFSNTELSFITEFMPNSVFNFFGDYQQCINQKGISNGSMLSIGNIFSKYYQVNENYRNAKAITQYVNKRFGKNMLGIGLAGKVIEKSEPVAMTLEKGDRGAIIVAEDNFDKIELFGQQIFYYIIENKIYRDAYNVIPVSLTKGLEFERVIVITKGMTENQKYVACTRAIKELQVVD